MDEAIAWHEKKAEHYRRIVARMRRDGCKTKDMLTWADKMDHHAESAQALRKLKTT